MYGVKKYSVMWLPALIVASAALMSNTVIAEPLAWWDADFAYRRPIVVQAGSAPIPVGYSVAMTFDHAVLVAQGMSRPDGADLRIARWTGSAWIEIDRVLEPGSGFDSTSTMVWFALQSGLAASTPDSNYYLYYGNATPTDPPDDEASVFPFVDFFERPSNDTVGEGWIVTEGAGDVDVAAGTLFFDKTSGLDNRPVVDHVHPAFTGHFVWRLGFDWERTGYDSDYRLHIQLGDSSEMEDPPPESSSWSNAGIGPSLLWACPSEGMSQHEGFGYEYGGSITELDVVTGQSEIEIHVDVPGNTYDVYVNGSNIGSGIPFTSFLGSIDRMRFLCWRLDENSFSRRCIRHTYVREVVVSPPTTTLGDQEWVASSVLPDANRKVELYGNRPNPFNPQTTIEFELATQAVVDLSVYDVAGRLVYVLVDGETKGPGRHEVVWRGRDVKGRSAPAGVYFYRLATADYSETKRMVLVK